MPNLDDRLPSAEGSLRVAVVGLGYWGPNLVRVLQELQGATPVLACDSSSTALSSVALRYPHLRTASSFVEVCDDEEVDAVAIATPVSTHYELAAAALEAGKHVFVEKPLAASTQQAQSLIELADRNGRVLMPGHTFLYSPPVNMGRELIRAGELGDIYFISTSRVNLGQHQSDVSVVWDLGPHDFSILRYWLDDMPVRVSAVSRGCVMADTPDVSFINLEFPLGTIAHVELSWLAPSKLRRTAIVGSKKMLVYDDTSSEPIRIFDSGAHLPDPKTFGEFKLTYRTGDILSPRVEGIEPLRLELEDFCQSILTGEEPRSSSGLGLDVLRIIEAVDRSLEERGAPVSLDSVGVPARV
jgi:predicted dehydrogenase